MGSEQLWVEPSGTMILARLRGVPTEDLLRKCQELVLQLAKDTGQWKVLYDALELELPNVEPALVQQKLETELESGTRLRRAIVVQNSRVAYHARLAFGAGDYRVFYNDIGAAIRWLKE
ncbi:MAG TPA: hypothetical protein VIY53_17145 [Acidobacteriaceae bacterium]